MLLTFLLKHILMFLIGLFSFFSLVFLLTHLHIWSFVFSRKYFLRFFPHLFQSFKVSSNRFNIDSSFYQSFAWLFIIFFSLLFFFVCVRLNTEDTSGVHSAVSLLLAGHLCRNHGFECPNLYDIPLWRDFLYSFFFLRRFLGRWLICFLICFSFNKLWSPFCSLSSFSIHLPYTSFFDCPAIH